MTERASNQEANRHKVTPKEFGLAVVDVMGGVLIKSGIDMYKRLQREPLSVEKGQFNVFTRDAEEYLKKHDTATVILAVEARTRPDFSSHATPQEAQTEAGKKDLGDLTNVLEAAHEKDETIIFKPQYAHSTVELTAPSEYVRTLAKREDVTEVYLPLNKQS